MKNSGTEIVASETMLDQRSCHLPSLIAAMIPRPTESGTAHKRSNASQEQCILELLHQFGKDFTLVGQRMSEVALNGAGKPFEITDSSRPFKPSSSRKAARVSGVAPWPSTALATSPGRISVAAKIGHYSQEG